MKLNWIYENNSEKYFIYKNYVIGATFPNGWNGWVYNIYNNLEDMALKDNQVHKPVNTKPYEAIEPTIMKKKRMALSVKNLKTIIDKFLINTEFQADNKIQVSAGKSTNNNPELKTRGEQR